MSHPELVEGWKNAYFNMFPYGIVDRQAQHDTISRYSTFWTAPFEGRG